MKETKDLVPAAAQGGALASYDYGDQAGAGFENQTQDDVAIPFLSVLQAISPEVAGEPGRRIKGATAGCLLNTVTKEIFDGDQGVICQPCSTNHVFVEWKPRNQGGGFVAVHQLDSNIVMDAKANQPFGKYKTPAGNDLIETFYMAVLMHRSSDLAEQATLPPEPFLIAFTSTKVKSYKAIMTRLRTVKGNPPMFAHRLLLKTVTETNTEGTFSNFAITPLIGNDVIRSLIPPALNDAKHPLLIAGSALMEAYSAGQMNTNYEASAPVAGGGTARNEKPAF